MPERLAYCNVAEPFGAWTALSASGLPADIGSTEHVRHAQVFAECTSVQDTVGMANGGISSDIAKFMHRKQGVYG